MKTTLKLHSFAGKEPTSWLNLQNVIAGVSTIGVILASRPDLIPVMIILSTVFSSSKNEEK